MTAILDTSFLFALTDKSDRNHQRVLKVAQNVSEKLILPIAVLPEICYLISSRLGHTAMRQFVTSMTPETVQIESVTSRAFPAHQGANGARFTAVIAMAVLFCTDLKRNLLKILFNKLVKILAQLLRINCNYFR